MNKAGNGRQDRLTSIQPPSMAKKDHAEVPVSMWKSGMVCVEIPELHHDPESPMPVVWGSTMERALELKDKALYGRAGVGKNVTKSQVDMAAVAGKSSGGANASALKARMNREAVGK